MSQERTHEEGLFQEANQVPDSKKKKKTEEEADIVLIAFNDKSENYEMVEDISDEEVAYV
jgi:hypothetical protein